MTRPRSPKTGVHALHVRERQDHALHLRRQGHDYPAVARLAGYASASTAAAAVRAALDRQPAEDAHVVRQVELAALDALYVKAWEILDRDVTVVSQGRVIAEIVDYQLKLAALDRCLRVRESRRKLLGADAPTRTRIEVITQDVLDAEIIRLEAELADCGGVAGEPAAPSGATPTES